MAAVAQLRADQEHVLMETLEEWAAIAGARAAQMQGLESVLARAELESDAAQALAAAEASLAGAVAAAAGLPESWHSAAVAERDLTRLFWPVYSAAASEARLEHTRQQAADMAEQWLHRGELAGERSMPALATRELAHSKRFAAIAAMLGRQLRRQTEELSSVLHRMRQLEGRVAELQAREAAWRRKRER